MVFEPTSGIAEYGWASSFAVFRDASVVEIYTSLAGFLAQVSESQGRAWNQSIAPLQNEVSEIIDRNYDAADYTAILEYTLPMEQRRPDVILLSSGSVYVLELKGKVSLTQADVDQVAAYARDLSAYHAECHGRPVVPLLVLTGARGFVAERAGVRVIGLDDVDRIVEELDDPDFDEPISPVAFLSDDAYTPLPTIVQAARELFTKHEVRWVERAAAFTQPALDAITGIIHEAARTKTRRLVLLTGIPGAGKTVVGLQIAHAQYLDDLVVPRQSGRTVAPAVYLSGNGPLVDVLQWEFADAGGGGKAFVRPVKDYVARYSKNPTAVPPEHVLIYDEAQRAWDAEHMARKHSSAAHSRSEPEHFIEFAERIPEWCVVVGLIGGGQEIHVGEEGGLGQWHSAVERSAAGGWIVHGPPHVMEAFDGYQSFRSSDALHLGRELRFHLASDVDRFADGLLSGEEAEMLSAIAEGLEKAGFHLRVTRDLGLAKSYLSERYREHADARYGIVASSRAVELKDLGINNKLGPFSGFRYGPWFVKGEDDPRSCRSFHDCVTEFGCQGLELDSVLLAWGTDFIRENGMWTNRLMMKYRSPGQIRDASQLRRNSYRVLLTRARDANVVWVHGNPDLDETFEHLVRSGFRLLT